LKANKRDRHRQTVIHSGPTESRMWSVGPLQAFDHRILFEGSGVDVRFTVSTPSAYTVHFWTPDEWKALLPWQRPRMATFDKRIGFYVAILFGYMLPGEEEPVEEFPWDEKVGGR
jgi:hypothetical protein